MLLTPPQLRAWTEYDRLSRFLRDPLEPFRTALQAAAGRPQEAEALDALCERVLRALAAADRAFPELWLDRVARYRWEAGREYVDVLAEARAVQLARYRHTRRADQPLEVEVIPGHPGALCDDCRAVAHTRYDLRTMLRGSPLPVVGCRCFVTATRPGLCTCWYTLRDLPMTTRERATEELIRQCLEAVLDVLVPLRKREPPPDAVFNADERLARTARPEDALGAAPLDEDDVGLDLQLIAGDGRLHTRDVPDAEREREQE